MNNLEYYINKNKHTCVVLPKKVSAHLQINNYLSEYTTDSERLLVLHNLGIDTLIEQLENLINSLLNNITEIVPNISSDFYNAGSQNNLNSAIASVPTKNIKTGQVITFKDSEGWKWYQYVGTNNSISTWSDSINNWVELHFYKEAVGLKLSSKNPYISVIGNRTTSDLTIKAVGGKITQLNYTDNSGGIKNVLIPNGTSIEEQEIEVAVSNSKNTTCTITAKINGEIVTASYTFELTYPVWAKFGPYASNEVWNNSWTIPFGTNNDSLNSKNMNSSKIIQNLANNLHLYIILPRLFNVQVKMNGFDFPFEEAFEISSSYDNVNFKMYRSKNSYEMGSYPIELTYSKV